MLADQTVNSGQHFMPFDLHVSAYYMHRILCIRFLMHAWKIKKELLMHMQAVKKGMQAYVSLYMEDQN